MALASLSLAGVVVAASTRRTSLSLAADGVAPPSSTVGDTEGSSVEACRGRLLTLGD